MPILKKYTLKKEIIKESIKKQSNRWKYSKKNVNSVRKWWKTEGKNTSNDSHGNKSSFVCSQLDASLSKFILISMFLKINQICFLWLLLCSAVTYRGFLHCPFYV